MGMNWCEDRLHDHIRDLDKVNELWDIQCFGKATQERCDAIEKELKRVKTQIELTIEDLQSWGP